MQLPLEAIYKSLSESVLAALGVEARLRMLLSHPTIRALAPPAARVRSLAAVTQLVKAEDHAGIFQAGAPADALWILMHGRVDLLDAAGAVRTTVDATAAPPLGQSPRRHAKQLYTAMAAEAGCLLLRAPPAASEALTAILAPPRVVAIQDQAAAPSLGAHVAVLSFAGGASAPIGLPRLEAAVAAPRMV